MHAARWLRGLGVFLILTAFAIGAAGARHAVPAAAQVEGNASSTDGYSIQMPLTTSGSSQVASLSPLCRAGVSAWGEQLRSYDLISTFGVGWYIDFGSYGGNVAAMQGAEFLPIVHLEQTRPDDPPSVDEPIACGPDYGYTISPPLTPSGLGALVSRNPARTWIIGNEPDRRVAQDDICPQQYAEAYHDAYHFIKSYDPSAKVAFAGLVQVTPGRLQYLDIVWNTYRQKYGTTMPVDVWTFHVYILPETGHGDAHIALGTDPSVAIQPSYECGEPNAYCSAEHDDVDLFAEQVIWMRTWMKKHGQQDKPLLLTEFGINLPYDYYGTCNSTVCPTEGLDGCFCDTNGETFHPARVADYLTATFNYLMMEAKDPDLGYPLDDYRLVQQWAWFSVATIGPGSASNLTEPASDGLSYTLTAPGVAYQQWAAGVSTQANLFPVRVSAVSNGPGDMTAPVTATLSVEISNSGNAAMTQPMAVTFYSDADLTLPIGSATVDSVPGCGKRGLAVSVQWPEVPAGIHRYWVKVDSGDAVSESSETDNVMQGTFIANGFRNFMPVTVRSF